MKVQAASNFSNLKLFWGVEARANSGIVSLIWPHAWSSRGARLRHSRQCRRECLGIPQRARRIQPSGHLSLLHRRRRKKSHPRLPSRLTRSRRRQCNRLQPQCHRRSHRHHHRQQACRSLAGSVRLLYPTTASAAGPAASARRCQASAKMQHGTRALAARGTRFADKNQRGLRSLVTNEGSRKHPCIATFISQSSSHDLQG